MKIISFCVGIQLGLLAGLVAVFTILSKPNKANLVYENKEIIVWKYNDTVWESSKLTDYREQFMRLPTNNG